MDATDAYLRERRLADTIIDHLLESVSRYNEIIDLDADLVGFGVNEDGEPLSDAPGSRYTVLRGLREIQDMRDGIPTWFTIED